MSEDELETIREQKRERLAERAEGGENVDGGENVEGRESTEGGERAERGEGAQDNAAPDEPIRVESVEQFSTVTTDYDVVLIDFYADWCGPCKMLEPVVASVAQNTDAAVAKVDIDQQQGLASQYGVRSVPTLVLFADGEQVEQLVGRQDEEMLTNLVKRFT